MMSGNQHRYPLHIHIATLFIMLIALSGGALVWFHQEESKIVIFKGTQNIIERVSNEILLLFQKQYRPVTRVVSLVAKLEHVNTHVFEERLSLLPILGEAFEDTDNVSGIQIGYKNGDYLILRSFNYLKTREKYDFNKNASYIMELITTNQEGQRVITEYYLDNFYKVISTRSQGTTDFDPRKRSWYINALDKDKVVLEKPYLFYFLKTLGTTISKKADDGSFVVAADVTMDQVANTLSEISITPSTRKVIFFEDGNVLGYLKGDVTKNIRTIEEISDPVLKSVIKNINTQSEFEVLQFDDEKWVVSANKLSTFSGSNLYLVLAIPYAELLKDIIAIQKDSLIITALILLGSLPMAYWIASMVSRPLRTMLTETSEIQHFNFEQPITTRSFIKEVDELALSMDIMQSTISKFLKLIKTLSSEKDIEKLLQLIASETIENSNADGILVYLKENDEAHASYLNFLDQEFSVADFPVMDSKVLEVVIHESQKQGFLHTQINTDIEEAKLISRYLQMTINVESMDLLSVPLYNRNNVFIGFISLIYARSKPDVSQAHVGFTRALFGFAAVSIESRQLYNKQKELLDAFIKLIAQAIDTKSPYTGGHCQRVPELTKMLADAACKSDAPTFKDFKLTDEQWEELHIAAWLHDCGKVTTPEYVVDKSTKLETLYDRIHEIRMRFEVLKRDEEISYWKALSNGADPMLLKKQLESNLKQLDNDFAFIAECNEGGEFMAPEKIERLEAIANKKWLRTLSDRIGISWEEKHRKAQIPEPVLPVEEKLLNDRIDHIIKRDSEGLYDINNPWGFKLNTPEYKFNRGELYNLKIARGTLSDEERFIINDHIMQTIIMLDKLPFPEHLKNIPSIAGGHHEKMDGTGYPKKLHGSDMPLSARMMAIADIFEALTASDRPYKKAKTLSEAIKIMSIMVEERHIDPDLFKLFLSSGVYQKYGERFLHAEQIDDVDINEYINQESV